jgi:lipopolysaccharide export system permease protein
MKNSISLKNIISVRNRISLKNIFSVRNSILDTYIIKKFLLALSLSLGGFLFIYIITNLIENIGYFVDKKASLLIILRYYLLFSPKTIILLMPLATLMGIYFSLGLITKHNEVLALRGLGFPPFKIYQPIFFYGFLVSLIVLTFNLSCVPRSKELLKEFKRREIDKLDDFTKSYARDIKYITDEGKFVSISRLDDNTIHEIYILGYKDGKLASRADAEKAEWKDSSWTFYKVYLRNFVDDRIFLEYSDEKIFEDFKTPPGELAKTKHDPMNLSFLDLVRYIKKLDRSGQKSNHERIELLERISYPFVGSIILLFGCPLALEVKRRGLLFGFGLGTLSAFTFWGIIQLFKELGIKGSLPPSLSILIPDVIFLSIGLYFMLTKEHS